MCELTTTKLKATTGYKLVAYDEVNYLFLSTFTGQVYMDGFLPEIEEGTPLISYWAYLRNSNDCWYFNKVMVGRTAVFLTLDSLEKFIDRAKRSSSSWNSALNWRNDSNPFGLKTVIVKARVAYDVLAGSYNDHLVAAGRKITFLEIVETI